MGNKNKPVNYKEIIGREPSCALEKMFFDSIYYETIENARHIINNPVIDLNKKGEIIFTLKKANLENYDPDKNPEGLGIRDWFENYSKEARVSTAGIRGQQNVLFPWDTRYPINLIGMLLATTGKALAARKIYGQDANLQKIAGTEVRYNSDKYLDIIARTQAAYNIVTHLPENRHTIPIWLTSFLVFKLDLVGGEYVTSSHAQSIKIATKDINNQGSQYLPDESKLFVDEIANILKKVEQDGKYELKIAASNDSHICENVDGIDLYVDYLKKGVASDDNLKLIKDIQNKIIIESMGGSAYRTLNEVLKKLKIQESFEWSNIEEDPFFHGAGKADKDLKTGKSGFYDYSADTSLVINNPDGSARFPVLETMGYDKSLANKPVKTTIFITDPDHDRLSIAQIENKDRIPKLKKSGINYMDLKNGNILTVYTPNQGFLMLMDFYAKQLKKQGKWDNHPRFIIKTTASAKSWDEWAYKNDVKVINVPVGFKEIASIMKKIEKQLCENINKPVIIRDIFDKEINLGINPRLLFAGEESGGMIMGPEELIQSNAGRKAIAMREKSATEAILVAASLISSLEKSGMLLSENLEKIFSENKIIGKYDIREDVVYYNESLPIEELKEAKKKGEKLRTKNDVFYLGMALDLKNKKININQVQEILKETFSDLDFSNLTDIKFVGDGTYLEFTDKYIEVRPSGTDAVTKAYGAGKDRAECLKYAKALGNYDGERGLLHQKYISDKYYEEEEDMPNIKKIVMEIYENWSKEGAPADKFQIPDYKDTLSEII